MEALQGSANLARKMRGHCLNWLESALSWTVLVQSVEQFEHAQVAIPMFVKVAPLNQQLMPLTSMHQAMTS